MDFIPYYQELWLTCLPCHGLRQLQLEGLKVQLGPSDGCPGVLQDCTGLTVLDLQECTVVQDISAAFAAIAALPELQHLSLIEASYHTEISILPAFQHPSKLTHLTFAFRYRKPGGQHIDVHIPHLRRLSLMGNLQHLELYGLPSSAVPGGFPSELVKLTSLCVRYDRCQVVEQFQHLSSFTAMQDLSIYCRPQGLGFRSLPGLQHLAQLTRLELDMYVSPQLSRLEFSTAITCSWTALQSLTLSSCAMHAEALAGLTQLQMLSLCAVEGLGHTTEELVLAVSKLCLLTELHWRSEHTSFEPFTSAAACAALTASTKLCVLEVGQCGDPSGLLPPVLFQCSTLYPHLHKLHVGLPVNEEQLQLLCSCCTGLKELDVDWWEANPDTAWMPLLQLTALTALCVRSINTATAAALSFAPQLTGLRTLCLSDLSGMSDPALLQLTCLTALQELRLVRGYEPGHQLGHFPGRRSVHLRTKAHTRDPPDVWIQLLRFLLRDPACRHALLKCSTAAAASPAKLMLAQLAATLAEELPIQPSSPPNMYNDSDDSDGSDDFDGSDESDGSGNPDESDGFEESD